MLTTIKPNDRSAVIYWITGWRLLVIFTAFSFLSRSHYDSTKDVSHSVILCVGMMSAVFGLTAYRFWPRLGFLFFIGTLAAHLGHTDFATNLASANTSDLLTRFIAVSRTAIFEIILAASVTFVGKSLMRVKHGPDGYIDTFDVSPILTRRFIFAVLTLPIVTITRLKRPVSSWAIFIGRTLFCWVNCVITQSGLSHSSPLGLEPRFT